MTASTLKVPNELFDMVEEGTITPAAAWTYVALLGLCNEAGPGNRVSPTRQELAVRCGLKKGNSIDRRLAELEANEVISIERGRKNEYGGTDSNCYTLLLPIY